MAIGGHVNDHGRRTDFLVPVKSAHPWEEEGALEWYAERNCRPVRQRFAVLLASFISEHLLHKGRKDKAEDEQETALKEDTTHYD